MAIVDKYANADTESGKLALSANLTGNKVVTSVVSFELGASDSNGSIYRVFPDMNANLIPVDIKIMNDAAGSSANDFDLGLYAGDKGAVIDKDLFYDGLDIHTAHAKAAAVDGLTALGIEKLGQPLYKIAGHTLATKKETYDIALTANTASGAAGTVTLVGTFIQG